MIEAAALGTLIYAVIAIDLLLQIRHELMHDVKKLLSSVN